MNKHLTLEQFLKSDLEEHYNYYPCGTKKEHFIKTSDGYWHKFTYDQNGRELKYENSNGDWYRFTYDQNGNKKTYEDSGGTKRGFEPLEITIDEALKVLKEHYGNDVKIIIE